MSRLLGSRIRTLVLASVLAVYACDQAGNGPAPDEGLQAVLAAVQSTVDLTYQVSSFQDVSRLDPEAFRLPFTQDAVLGFVREGEFVALTVDDYVAIRRSMAESGDPRSLVEWELEGRTEVYGDIAHRVSSYAVRLDGAEDIAERGVMSFQLVRVKDGWRVNSLIWQVETDEFPIPPRYLPGGGS